MKLSSINIFRMVVVTILICFGAFWLIRRYYGYLQTLEYKAKNIYEIVTLNPKPEDDKICLTSYYMICEPGETEKDIQRQMDTFLSEQDVLTHLKETYLPTESPENIRFHLVFIRPTKDWPVGKISDNRDGFDLWTGMVVASVTIENGECRYSVGID